MAPAACILFDLGGVVLSVDPDRAIRALRAQSRRPPALAEMWNEASRHWVYPAVQAVMEGRLAPEAFFRRMQKELALPPELS
jgi:hypothetical protein